MQLVEGQEKNGFAAYCGKNKEDENNNPEDIVTFDEFIGRIESTYKDTKDTIYTEAFFKLIDADGDGVISHADLESMNPELGVPSCMN
jgi:Ca2+-binding EF-hand superfamily protein